MVMWDEIAAEIAAVIDSTQRAIQRANIWRGRRLPVRPLSVHRRRGLPHFGEHRFCLLDRVIGFRHTAINGGL